MRSIHHCFASLQGHKDVIKMLLKNGATVNVADNGKNTPLHYAALRGHEKVVEVLLNSGAEVNVSNDHIMTPLHFALAINNMNTVELLLKKYVDNPLHWAAINYNLDVVKYSIKNGYNVNAVNELEATPLHLASLHGNLHVVEFLTKEKGVDINAVDKNNFTTLTFAAVKGYVEIVKILLSNGARVDIGTDEGATPLHYAALNGHKNVVEILLNKVANTIVSDKSGSTPLHYAVEGGPKDVIKVLLDNGAVIAIRDNFGYTLNYASNDSIKNILASTKNLFIQVKKGDLQKAKDCLSKGAVVNAQCTNGGRPLHYAAWKDYVEIVEVLLKNEANGSLKTIKDLLSRVTDKSKPQHVEEQAFGTVSLEECLPR
ncbi:uncharacterized protein LOC143373497 [Andrena cerasifolii]|uniref:uncharacterized protein LOC143373497 n=1 Tax=Andrena cerasifolii TaxID=2819439 RepID=UPI004037B798